MTQGHPTRDQITILLLGTVRSEKQDFFSKLNSFSLLLITDKEGRIVMNIPAWPVLGALAVYIVVRAIRSRK